MTIDQPDLFADFDFAPGDAVRLKGARGYSQAFVVRSRLIRDDGIARAAVYEVVAVASSGTLAGTYIEGLLLEPARLPA